MADYMLSGEVAELFNVDPKTVSRWARQGKLPYKLTLGGIHRYPRIAIEAMAAGLEYHLPTEAGSKVEPEPVEVVA